MGEADADAGLDLRRALTVIRRRRWAIIVAVVLTIGVTVLVTSLQAPVYRSTATVLLEVPAGALILDLGSGQTDSAVLNLAHVHTEMEVIRSRRVRQAVADALGHAPSVEVTQRGDSNVVAVTASSGSSVGAAEDAQAYVETYIEFRRSQLVVDLTATAAQVQELIDGIDRRLDDPGVPAEEVASLRTRREQAESQRDELDLATNVMQQGGAQLLSDAAPPAEPSEPTPVRNGLLAVSLGLLLGLGVAFSLDRLDDRFSDADALAGITDGVPLLATVPAVRRRDRGTKPSNNRQGAADEAYRMLRTALDFAFVDHPNRRILIVSPGPLDGKTTTAIHLAAAVAEGGRQVALVDCDLRRPRVAYYFGVDAAKGFTSVLLGTTTVADALVPATGHERLTLLPSGPTPPNPSELLASVAARRALDDVGRHAEVTVIDAPPLLPVTDSMVLSQMVDGVVLVVRARHTRAADVRRTLQLLRRASAPLVGIVLNGVKASDGSGYTNYPAVTSGDEPPARTFASVIDGS